MAEQQKFLSDESSSTVSNKWVFSVAPNIYPTSGHDPYKVVDQKKSTMQLRLMPYGENGGGTRVMFNVTLPQYQVIVKAAEEAVLGHLDAWDLATAYGDTLSRIFGTPDEKGRCPARMLVLRREPVMADGSKAKLPWRIEILNGTGVKVQMQTGAAFMKGGTFQANPDGRVMARLSDGQMYENLMWGKELMNILFASAKDGVLKGHRMVMEGKEKYKKH